MVIGMVQYYRVTLALPPAVAVAAYALGRGGNVLEPSTANTLWFSLVLGGLPYFALAAFMFFWIGGKSERTIHQVIYLSPFFMVVLVAVAAAVFLPVLRGASAVDRGLVDAIAQQSIFTLVLGYLYVAAVQLAYLGLRAMNRIAVGPER